jgi:cell division septation protein DedD
MQDNEFFDDNIDDVKTYRHSGFLIASSIIASIIFFAGLLFYAYNSYYKSKAPQELIILSAQDEIVKIKSNEFGDAGVLDTDKEFFSNLNEKLAVKEKVVTSNNEEPIDKSTLNPELNIQPDEQKNKDTQNPQDTKSKIVSAFAALDEKTLTTEKLKIQTDAFAIIDKPELVNAPPTNPESSDKKDSQNTSPSTSLSDIDLERESNENEEEKEEVALNEITDTPAKVKKFAQGIDEKQIFKHKNDHFRLQIASFTSKKDAIAFFKKAKSKDSKIFEKLESHIEAKQTPEKGHFYRLSVGAFFDESQAKQMCKKLKQNNYECFIIRPEND